MPEVITNNLDLWTSALLTKSTAGRGSNGKLEAYGIKKLRELILELAMRGKLIPQNPDDEPASVLLGKNTEERMRLERKNEIRSKKELPEIREEEKKFDLPNGWEWVKLGELTEMYNGRAFKSSEWGEKGLPIIRIQNLNDPTATFNYFDGDLAEQHLVKDGTFLISWSGTPGTSFGAFIWNRGAAALNQHINKCRVFLKDVDLEYLRLSVNSCMDHLISSAQGGVGLKHVTRGTLDNIVFGFPPLSEQHRIVAKVDELMALCDQLEQQQTHSIEAHQTLVETVLSALVRPTAMDGGSEENAGAIFFKHFDTLFTTEHSIDQLKQTILQLAVMGKLVPQDPNDEPATVLLERVAGEKEQLASNNKIKKVSSLPDISDDEMPFQLPELWRWARFGWLVNFKSELVRPEEFADLDQVAPDSIEKGTGKLLYQRTVSESGVRGPNNRFYPGQILYSKIRPSLSKAIIAPFEGLCSADMYPLESMIDAAFLLKAILSEPFLEQVRVAENRIKMPKLNIDSLSNMVVPVPPLAEQDRIVAKVDELMALCDALKARLKDAQTTQIHLADAIVEQAVA